MLTKFKKAAFNSRGWYILFTVPIHRTTVCIALAILTISLASLGVKLPWGAGISSSSGKPKPRPRAIIETQIKTCKKVIQDIPTVCALLADPPAIAVSAILLLTLAPLTECYLSCPPLQQKSRDPPVLA